MNIDEVVALANEKELEISPRLSARYVLLYNKTPVGRVYAPKGAEPGQGYVFECDDEKIERLKQPQAVETTASLSIDQLAGIAEKHGLKIYASGTNSFFLCYNSMVVGYASLEGNKGFFSRQKKYLLELKTAGLEAAKKKEAAKASTGVQ